MCDYANPIYKSKLRQDRDESLISMQLLSLESKAFHLT